MIEVTQLGKTYPGGVEAVKAVDFDVRAGEVFGLLGPNGAGKSTTIGMLTTTIEPSSGTARLAGFDVAKQPREARRVSSVGFRSPSSTGRSPDTAIFSCTPDFGRSTRTPRANGSRTSSTRSRSATK